MKKKLLILAAIFLGAMSFSAPKDDYVKAIQNFKNTNNEKIFKEDLSKILNQKEIDKELKVELYQNLYYLEKDINKKITYLNALVELEPNQLNYKILLVVDNKLNKNDKKSNELYSMYTKNLKEVEKEAFDTLLAKLYLNTNLKKDAEQIATRLLKSKDKVIQSEANKILAIISLSNKEIEKSIKYLEVANALTQSKDEETVNILANLYAQNKKFDKAYDVLLKLARNLKTGAYYPETILFAEMLNKNVNEIYGEYKNILKKEQKILINLDLANRFIASGYLDLGIKYANKAIKEDKKNEGNILLALAYANKNDKKNALKYIKEAKKFKIDGAEKLEKEINQKLK